MESKAQQTIIKEYKEYLREYGLEGELYKWQLLAEFRGRPNPAAADFFEEIKAVNFGNLIYPVGLAVIKHISKDRTKEYQKCFQFLFDENEPLENRISMFPDMVNKIYREIQSDEKLGHHHDERTMATFLTYYNPEKYAFYKNSFYKKYCDLLGIKSKKKNQKYIHYLALLDDFIENHLKKDTELLTIVKGLIAPIAFQDNNLKLLAQDILYRSLDEKLGQTKNENLTKRINLNGAKLYKVSMGEKEFSDEEVKQAIKDKIVIIHKDTKPKGRTAIPQGETFTHEAKVGDYFYLTHGNKEIKLIGRFTSDSTLTNMKDWGEEGWVERSFEIIERSKQSKPYKKKSKWWTPNNSSTFIEIPANELQDANELIFRDYFNIEFFLNEKEEIKRETKISMNTSNNFYPLNQILYGPPGTGKTYHTINKAIAIIDPDFDLDQERTIINEQFELLKEKGLVVFTTFHQSMTYEDFVEGIKPQEPDNEGEPVIYKIEPGIFRQLCVEAAFSKVQNSKSEITEKAIDFSSLYDQYIEQISEALTKGEPLKLKTRTDGVILIKSLSAQGNIITEHIGGKRDYTVSKGRLSKINAAFEDINNISNVNAAFRKIIGGSNATAYWAVLNAIRQLEPNTTTTQITEQVYSFEDKLSIIKELRRKDYQTPSDQAYVLIIDEINRGNVSAIFGELITLIEKDKRLGEKEALDVTLPYSKDSFGVPNNLYIIGTMNTADRSVEALDTALRRRFRFEEMQPDPKVILENTTETNQSIRELCKTVLETINKRIEILLDRDHLIGHSYFLTVENEQDLKVVFAEKIIPLLQEYFYGDYGKIALVLGEEFCSGKANPNTNGVFAKVQHYDADAYSEKVIYTIADIFKEDFNISKAIEVLLNNNSPNEG